MNELYHHGIKGQRWGYRRWQNSDGSLTEAGKKRYGYGLKTNSSRYESKRQKAYEESVNTVNKASKQAQKANKKLENFSKNNKSINNDKKRNKLYDNKIKTSKEYSNQKRMHELLMKNMKMSPTEQKYRSAKKTYNDYINGKNLSIPLKYTIGNGIFATSARIIFTKKGKELGNKLSSAYHDYQNVAKTPYSYVRQNRSNTQAAIRAANFNTRAATIAANRAASLSITGGTNPFMFG